VILIPTRPLEHGHYTMKADTPGCEYEYQQPEQNGNEILVDWDWEVPMGAERSWVVENKYEWGEPFDTPYYMDR